MAAFQALPRTSSKLPLYLISQDQLHMHDWSWNNPLGIAAYIFLAQIDHESWGITLYEWCRAVKQNNTKPTKNTMKLMETS